ncbi:MAG: hypothetical protein IPM06_06660 [Rhizobiales bacterium]|nr:hypothetical protein [Hyphomicrobiales bacterium]
MNLTGKPSELYQQLFFSFTDEEWHQVCRHYDFSRDGKEKARLARMFITSAVNKYCREAILQLRQSEVKATLIDVVTAFRKIRPKVDKLRALNDLKQAITSIPILKDGPSGRRLLTERFEEHQDFVQLLEGCLEEMPKVPTGPKDKSIPLLLDELQSYLEQRSIDGSLSPSDPRWTGPKANLRFLAAIMKSTKRVTNVDMPDEKLKESLHRFITRLNKDRIDR